MPSAVVFTAVSVDTVTDIFSDCGGGVRVNFVGNQDHLRDEAAQIRLPGCDGEARRAARSAMSRPRRADQHVFVWLQHARPDQGRYQQKRASPYIYVAHPRARSHLRWVVASPVPACPRTAPYPPRGVAGYRC
jgi:hypothetical protein